jgi:hypothetical protein
MVSMTDIASERVGSMGIGTSVFLLVLGAILAFAVHAPVDGINIHALGFILMGVGLLGGLLSALFWNSWGGGGWGAPSATVYRHRRTVVDRGVPVAVPAAPVGGAVPVVGSAVPVAVPAAPVVGSAVPVAGQAVPVVGGAVPVAGQAVPVVPAAVPVAAPRPVRVRRTTTVYDDRP